MTLDKALKDGYKIECQSRSEFIDLVDKAYKLGYAFKSDEKPNTEQLAKIVWEVVGSRVYVDSEDKAGRKIISVSRETLSKLRVKYFELE